MDATTTATSTRGSRWPWWAFLCVLTVVPRLHHLTSPLADNLQAKQTYSSNKARNIARAPFDPMRLSLDLLDEQGRPMQLAEEVPVYIGMLAALFDRFGESEIWGRLLSILASVIAVCCFFDLARRELGEKAARVAAVLFAMAPLFIFYGRAVMPDSWMLAMMAASAAAYRRYLDSGRWTWLVGAALCGSLAVLFKYWGLMIAMVLAGMALGSRGWRAWFKIDFIALSVVIAGPALLWLLLVFAPSPNPVQVSWVAGQPPTPYMVIQNPAVLLNRAVYAGLFGRFLFRDCGPAAAVLMILGGLAAARGKVAVPLLKTCLPAWALAGLLFYFLLAPKLIDHDYYELMMLPPAALWGALGWQALTGAAGLMVNGARGASRFRVAGAALLAACVLVVHAPWVSGGLFALEDGKVALGRALRNACAPGERVVALGPGIALIVPVHYSQRQGWAVRAVTLPDDWPERVAYWKSRGAALIGLYFDAKTLPGERRSYDSMIDALPVVDHRVGPPGKPDQAPMYEYVVLRTNEDTIAQRSIEDTRR